MEMMFLEKRRKRIKFRLKYWQWDLEDVVTKREKSDRLRKWIKEKLGITIVSDVHMRTVLEKYETRKERGYAG